MRILIATGIYPPEIGGPSYYAKNLAEALKIKGNHVDVVTFGKLKTWPTGLRHLALFLKTLPLLPGIDIVIALDTFSAAIPAFFAAKLLGKPVIVRTGGDFLWEQYLERTGDPLPLPFFYQDHKAFTGKERILFRLTKFLLQKVLIVFSTNMQKRVWMPAYGIREEKTRVIPNAITGQLENFPPAQKNFLAYGRNIKMRNYSKMREAFAIAKEKRPEIVLEEGQLPQRVLHERISHGYCLLSPSLTDISPNYILDGLRAGKPFILDKYSEYADTYKDLGLFVDPLDAEDIAAKIIQMADDTTYKKFTDEIAKHPLTRTYADLAEDFINLSRSEIEM